MGTIEVQLAFSANFMNMHIRWCVWHGVTFIYFITFPVSTSVFSRTLLYKRHLQLQEVRMNSSISTFSIT